MKRLLPLGLCLAVSAAQAQGLSKNIGGSGDSGGGESSADSSLTVPGHRVYLGADYADATLSVSDTGLPSIPGGKYTTKFLDLRAGYRVLDAIGLEAHVGVPAGDASADGGRLRQDQYYAAFVVPTATVFSSFELGFPLGYAHTRVQRKSNGTTGRETLDSIAYGVNLEVPIRVFFDGLPDFRIGGGGMVYSQKSGARDYGFHYGLRYDFGL